MSATAQDTLNHARSQSLFSRAQSVIPGGVNSPVRACKAVKAEPIFFRAGDGSQLVDVDGNIYIDYVGSWGALVLGHKHQRVMEAVEDALANGTSFGAPCSAEVTMAETITRLMPGIEMVRMVNSGTEACMSAIRLARAFSKRTLILKFEGCYHGHHDSFLSQAGSGLATLGISSSPGVPDDLAKLTVTVPFNDLAAIEKAFKEHKDQFAAVILEPVVGNAGLILPEEGFLKGVREISEKHKTLLIFDEVMTGFRVALGGAQGRYGIKPDLTCLGKVIGGGLPVGAYGGRRDIMEMVAPQGSVYQAGTLSGNPIAMAAGLAQLQALSAPDIFMRLEARTQQLHDGLLEIGKKSKNDFCIASICGMLSIFMQKGPVTDFASAKKSDTEKFARLWKALLNEGVYWPPSQFESAFISAEHSRKDIDQTLAAFEKALQQG